MDYERVLERLASCTELQRLSQLAVIFDTLKTTVDKWRKAYGFPAPVKIAPDLQTQTRYWRPDHVAEWTRQRMHIEKAGIPVKQVAALVGMHEETWLEWVKAGRAPPHRWVAFASGAHLWDEAELRAWLKERTGGYSLPRELRAPRSLETPRPRGRRRNAGKAESRP